MQDGSLLQTVSPTVLDPLARVSENKDWHGGRLYPDYNQSAPDYTKFYSGARESSKQVAEWMAEASMDPETLKSAVDVSPETLDMVFDFFTGSVGRFLADTGEGATALFTGAERELKDVPLARKVYGRIGRSDEQRAFYDAFYEIEDIRSNLSRIKRDSGPAAYQDALRGIGDRRRLLAYTQQTKARMTKLKGYLRMAEKGGKEEAAERHRAALDALMADYVKRYRKVLYGEG